MSLLIGQLVNAKEVADGILSSARHSVYKQVESFNLDILKSESYKKRVNDIKEESIALIIMQSQLKELETIQKEYNESSIEYRKLESQIQDCKWAISSLAETLVQDEFGYIRRDGLEHHEEIKELTAIISGLPAYQIEEAIEKVISLIKTKKDIYI